jgi:hypothetical protein
MPLRRLEWPARLSVEYAHENAFAWDDHTRAAWPHHAMTTWTTWRYAHENGCDFDAVQYSDAASMVGRLDCDEYCARRE